MEAGERLECAALKATMSPLDSFRTKKLHLQHLGITRVVLFGLALSALATLMWLRMDFRPQFWPKLLDALHVDTVDGVVVPPKMNLQQLGKRNPAMVHGAGSVIDVEFSSSSAGANCVSRSQQFKYRKKEYHFPLSEALTRALAEYTRMHSQCCAWNVNHGHDGEGVCQYVMYHEGYEGLGNRLLSLVAAFAYALVTSRALVIEGSRGHLAELLCEPFRDYYSGEDKKVKSNYTATWVVPSQVAHGVQQQAVTLEEAMGAQFVNVTAVHVKLRHEQTVGDQRFFCPEAQDGLRKVPWVIWESNQYYVPRLFMLREFWATKLRLWFPDVSRVFTQLGRVLCVPRNAVWDTIRRVHEGEMAWGAAKARVGIQVRRHGVSENASFSEEVYRRIVECVVEGGVVPPPMATIQLGAAKVAVLVTSLQSMYYDKMRERWNNTVVGSSSSSREAQVKFVMVSHEGTEQYSSDQARKAMVEMWLLSLCNDVLATSSWSTFGYVAHALAGMHPRILNIRGPHPELAQPSLPACSRGQSPEPCLHYPFTAVAATTSSSSSASACLPTTANSTDVAMAPLQQQHALWVARHIRACQDETRGLQLVA
jgi:xyloglucan fucosyltransferase